MTIPCWGEGSLRQHCSSTLKDNAVQSIAASSWLIKWLAGNWIAASFLLVAIWLPATLEAKDTFDPDERLAQARRLTQELTPFGAQRQGNGLDIPSWSGQGAKAYQVFDSFKTLTADNWQQQKEFLSPGQQQLFIQFPEDFQMRLYQSQRTASAPHWVYDNTYRNQIRTDLNPHTRSPEYALAGIPFPIPKTGIEVIWNHMARWRGGVREDGTALANLLEIQLPLSERPGTLDRIWQYSRASSQPTPRIRQLRLQMELPFYMEANQRPFRKEVLYRRQFLQKGKNGEHYRLTESADSFQGVGLKSRQLSGQQQAHWDSRLIPHEDRDLFAGRPGQFNWQLRGKRELWVPYNNQQLLGGGVSEADRLDALMPSALRYEKHRVWVLDATAKRGQAERYAKQLFYLDEDSWSILLAERYDAQGRLVRVGMAVPAVDPDGSGLLTSAEVTFHLYSRLYWASHYHWIKGQIEDKE